MVSAVNLDRGAGRPQSAAPEGFAARRPHFHGGHHLVLNTSEADALATSSSSSVHAQWPSVRSPVIQSKGPLQASSRVDSCYQSPTSQGTRLRYVVSMNVVDTSGTALPIAHRNIAPAVFSPVGCRGHAQSGTPAHRSPGLNSPQNSTVWPLSQAGSMSQTLSPTSLQVQTLSSNTLLQPTSPSRMTSLGAPTSPCASNGAFKSSASGTNARRGVATLRAASNVILLHHCVSRGASSPGRAAVATAPAPYETNTSLAGRVQIASTTQSTGVSSPAEVAGQNVMNKFVLPPNSPHAPQACAMQTLSGDVSTTYITRKSVPLTLLTPVLNPLVIRFSQARINPTFADGTMFDVTSRTFTYATCTVDGNERTYLQAPFPAIEVVAWRPKLRSLDGNAVRDKAGNPVFGKEQWFTLDNRRLYVLQRAAVAAWPRLCYVKVNVKNAVPGDRKIIGKFKTTSEGATILVGHAKDTMEKCQLWDFRVELERKRDDGLDGASSRKILVEETQRLETKAAYLASSAVGNVTNGVGDPSLSLNEVSPQRAMSKSSLPSPVRGSQQLQAAPPSIIVHSKLSTPFVAPHRGTKEVPTWSTWQWPWSPDNQLDEHRRMLNPFCV